MIKTLPAAGPKDISQETLKRFKTLSLNFNEFQSGRQTFDKFKSTL
jgi:hypothetical protein